MPRLYNRGLHEGKPVRLTNGATLGDYEILEPLGVGGMGEVYRARDRKLQRDVALKVVHPHLAGSDPMARFRREARALACMCHANVAGVHDFDEVDGVAFIVMELVPGETLAERLGRGAIPIAEAVRIAEQVAAALEAVHEKGIIHRDLKPANIKITGGGVVKVLDFGLAKQRDEAAGSAVTITSADRTADGTVVGTAAYMSPEQARGAELDRRSDVWSFGCVLFEMLSGRRAFAASTQADTIAHILERDVDWKSLPPATPPGIIRLLRRCLARDTAKRLRDMGDARLELADVGEHAADAIVPAAASRRNALVIGAGAFIAGAAIVTALLWPRLNGSDAANVTARFVMSMPQGLQLSGLDFPSVAIAPDGSNMAFVASRGGQTQLYLRPLDGLESRALPGTANAAAPFFSPDGRWVAFFAGGELKKVALSGGNPITLCEAPVGLGGSWNERDEIVFAATTGSAISKVSAFGGRPERVSTLDIDRGEFSHRWPEWLPGGDSIVYTVGTVGSWNDAQIVAQQLGTAEKTVIVERGTSPRYDPTGRLLYAHDGTIMALPFDRRRLSATGTATTLIEHVLQSEDGAAQFSVSPRGHAAYVEGTFGAEERRLVMVDRTGAATPLAAPPRAYHWPRVSPSGQAILLAIEDSTPDLWLYDLGSSGLTQITFDAGATFPLWSRDGQRVVYTSGRSGVANLFMTTMPRPGAGARLAVSEQMQIAGSWAEDDDLLAYVERRPDTGRDIMLVSQRDSRSARSWLASARDESAPRISPDGRWLAYVSNDTGREEIYVRSRLQTDRAAVVSTGGGSEPVWGSTSRELFYRTGDAVMAAQFEGADRRTVATRLLFRTDAASGTIDSPNFDVMPDGQRFIMIQQPSRAAPTVHVLTNWMSRTAPTSPR